MPARWTNESGAMLVEIMMSALVIAILAVGVMTGFDVSARFSGDHKHKAAAANLAEQELEKLRGERMSVITSLTGTPATIVQNGATYTVTRTAEWVSQPATGSICTAATGPPTYLRISVAVSWPGRSSKPVTITSLLTPGARGTLSEQGALVIRIKDSNGEAVAGVPVSIGGGYPQGVTDSSGCVSWSPVAADTYAMSFTKAGYQTDAGSTTVNDAISVPGQQLTEREYTYSQVSTLSGSFVTMRDTTPLPSNPRFGVTSGTPLVTIAHPSVPAKTAAVAADGTFSATVPPSDSAYTIYAGGCPAARPPAADETSQIVGPGANVTVQVAMPAINAVTRVQGTAVSGAVRYTDVCGVTYERPTSAGADGKLGDPGFAYSGSNRDLCGYLNYVQQGRDTPDTGTYFDHRSVANDSFTGEAHTLYDLTWDRRVNGSWERVRLLSPLCS